MTASQLLFVRATLAVAAAYVFFLLFAEFALLERARELGWTSESLRGLMGVLGLGGITGSALAAWAMTRRSWAQTLRAAFGLCVVAGLCSLFNYTSTVVIAFVFTGLGVGGVTVELATRLRSFAGPKRLGLCCGFGTGAAYLVCNLPFVFRGTPSQQGALAAAIALIGMFVVPNVTTSPPATVRRPQVLASAVAWVVIFLALVWLDSGAFYIIQHTTAIKSPTWGENAALFGNAGVHGTVAILAGLLLDRNRAGAVLASAALLLVIACLEIHYSQVRWSLALLYASGVSLYSTALVWCPARLEQPVFSAVLYSVAGWIGSALGIGMAEDRHDVPVIVSLLCAGVVTFALIRIRKSTGLVTAAIAMSLLGLSARAVSASEPSASIVAEGRRVYISEGCIYCHSQFLRSRVEKDMEQWGPSAASLQVRRAEQPPLVGSRRQGPDLSNVGNRRSAEWQRWHLQQPRLLIPHSRMPSYSYLFQGGDARGDALVAYLVSLGADTAADRAAQIRAWQPTVSPAGEPRDESPQLQRGENLFAQLCAVCHGPTGNGDGWLGTKLTNPPPNFQREAWRHIDPHASDRQTAIARIVKFGLPGTSMPGHEYLNDDDVLALAAYVAHLHTAEAFPR